MKRWRPWLWAALIFGLLAALILAGIYMPWQGQTIKVYTATALLHISMKTPHMVFPSTEREAPSQFEIYKATQEQLVKSQHVLNAALRDAEVRAFRPSAARWGAVAPTAWLASQLRVSFPGKNSELMMVSLTTPDPKEAAKLVNAVVTAYMREVVDLEREQLVPRRNELDKLCADKENEVRNKRNDIRQLAEQLDLADWHGGAVGQRLAMERVLASEKELAGLKGDLRRKRGELEVQKALGADCKRLEIQIKALEEILKECQKESEKFARESKKTEYDVDRFGDDVNGAPAGRRGF